MGNFDGDRKKTGMASFRFLSARSKELGEFNLARRNKRLMYNTRKKSERT